MELHKVYSNYCIFTKRHLYIYFVFYLITNQVTGYHATRCTGIYNVIQSDIPIKLISCRATYLRGSNGKYYEANSVKRASTHVTTVH